MSDVAIVEHNQAAFLPRDIDAIEIGELYARAGRSMVESAKYQYECGCRLAEKKASMPHGAWLPWLKEQADVLGFSSRRTAAMLMKAAANGKLTSHITPDEALAISRETWGNDGGRHSNLKGEYEWYTPEAVIESARLVMGGIDLDPASCEHANEVVKAEQFYSEEQNGVAQDWSGRVFVNPPFAHPTVRYFAEKLMESFSDGSVEQAIWLSNACVDVGWWQDLAGIGDVCFHRGRIKFYGQDGALQPPTMGQTIIYLGPNREAFRTEFLRFGLVLGA